MEEGEAGRKEMEMDSGWDTRTGWRWGDGDHEPEGQKEGGWCQSVEGLVGSRDFEVEGAGDPSPEVTLSLVPRYKRGVIHEEEVAVGRRENRSLCFTGVMSTMPVTRDL